MASEDKTEKERGGITKTGVKKTIWFHADEAEALRRAAFKVYEGFEEALEPAAKSFGRTIGCVTVWSFGLLIPLTPWAILSLLLLFFGFLD